MTASILDSWSFGAEPTDIHLFYIGADSVLWAADRATSKVLGYDLDGNFLYCLGDVRRLSWSACWVSTA